MDIRIRKYIQYKARTLNERKKELYKLTKKREELRRDVIDSSPAGMDGQPRGKGGTSNPTESKVLRLEKIDKRIEVLDTEIKKFADVEQKIFLMGRIANGVYKETILKEMNPEYIAMQLGISRASLFNIKAKILEFIATELGEYLNDEEE